MPWFSERNQLVPVRVALQMEAMNAALRTALWNLLNRQIYDRLTRSTVAYVALSDDPALNDFCKRVWDEFLYYPTDTIEGHWNSTYRVLKDEFHKWPWHRVYSFLEFTAARFPWPASRSDPALGFTKDVNAVLERERSAYRFVDNLISPITSPSEIDSVESALTQSPGLEPVAVHIQTALRLLTDRQAPDLRNSVKESISAVEAMCSLVAGHARADLDAALRRLESTLSIHPALRAAFIKLYGYTSDSDGIRHALMEEAALTTEDALFMLVTCSAFINFLKARLARVR